MGIELVTATSAQRPRRRILVVRTCRLIEIAFKHVALEPFLLALDAVSAIDCAVLFRHLSHDLEKSNLGADRLVFNRLANDELKGHVGAFLSMADGLLPGTAKRSFTSGDFTSGDLIGAEHCRGRPCAFDSHYSVSGGGAIAIVWRDFSAMPPFGAWLVIC
jgi:hypothetical protein